jgi:hypothetical protein
MLLWPAVAIASLSGLLLTVFVRRARWAALLSALIGWLAVVIPSWIGMHSTDLVAANESAEAFFLLLVLSPYWLALGLPGVLAGLIVKHLRGKP